VHISELAQQHVENPREIVAPGDEVKVKILEIDSERRRLSLSIKRVEGQVLPRRTEGLTGDAGDLEDMPELGLSEDVFAEAPATVEDDTPEAEAAEAEVVDAPVEEDEAAVAVEEEPVADEPAADADADAEPATESEPAAEAETETDIEAEAPTADELPADEPTPEETAAREE
jgi:small subunit ribosomal protein S1